MEATKKDRRPNFFVVLGINPYEAWNQAKFEQILKQKKAEWSRQSTNSVGTRQSQAKQNLEIFDIIHNVMSDDEKRTTEAQEAIAQQNSEKTIKIDTLEKRLALFNAKDSTDQKEIDAFIVEFKDVASAQEITQRIKVPIKTTTTAPHVLLDTTTSKNIAERLHAIGMTSLYELLNCPETTSTMILQRKAEQLYKDVSLSATKNQENTYKSELSGHAKVIFGSEEKRKQYNESLRQERFSPLLTDLDDLINPSSDKEVTLKQTNIFLDSAQKAGWNRQEALEKLKEHARNRKWSIQTPQIDASIQKIRCGNCRELNDNTQNYCIKCRQELFIQCPECDQRVLGEQNICGNCSFPVGNRYLVDIQLSEFQVLLRKQMLAQAQALLVETRTLWQPKKADRRTQKFEQFQAEIKHLEQTQRNATEQFQRLLTQKKYFAAQQFLSSAESSTIIDKTQQQAIIHSTISKAEALLRRAQIASTERNEKIELCRQVLLICSDYREARDFLQTLPPEEPCNVQAKIRGTIVSISWEASATKNVVYRIICKTYTQPHSAKDGRVLATIAGLTYEDDQPEVGVPLYYAVFAEYEHVISDKGGLLAQPILLIEDVTLLRAEINDHQVKLSWQPTHNAHTYVVVRKERIPSSSIQDGKTVAECDAQQYALVDRDVENGHTYYYTIYTRFKNHEGRIITSPGVRLKTIPEPPPQPIQELDIQPINTAERAVKLSWQRPMKGQALIIRSLQSLQKYNGQVLAETQLSSLGQRLEDQPDMVIDPQIPSGVVYYTPVILFNQHAYIGASQRYACVDGVTNLTQKNLGTAIRLQWNWPEQCQEVLVTFSMQEWAQPEDPNATTLRVSRAEYERVGYFDLHGTVETHYYIVITAIIVHKGETIAAQGVRIIAHLASFRIITYEIKRSALFHKRTSLFISTRTPGKLPTLLLVGANNRLPVRKTDGNVLHRIEAIQISTKGLHIELRLDALVPMTFGKLFLEDDSLYEMVQINHPHEDKLRIH